MSEAQRANRRGAHFTPEFQRAARAKVKTESLQESGRRGWRALLAKFGPDYAGSKAAEWRRNNPNGPTKEVISWLTEFCVAYQLEVKFGNHYADIVCPDFGLIIEVDGEHWHASDEAKARDAVKDKIFARHGYLVLRLTDKEIDAGRKGEAFGRLDFALHNSEAKWRN